MVAIQIQEHVSKCTPRTGTLLIGWFKFITCVIPFVALILYANNGAVGLDRFLYDRTAEMQFKHVYLNHLKQLVDQDEILKSIEYKYNHIYEARGFLKDFDHSDTQSIRDVSEEESNETKPAITLADINPSLAQFVHRYCFSFEQDAFSILILIIFTFGIGVTFHGLLLVGVYSNSGTPIAYWLAQQIMSIIFNLTLLVCLAIYSRNIVFMLIQSARIAFSLHCVMIVSRHHRSLYGSLDAKTIDAV